MLTCQQVREFGDLSNGKFIWALGFRIHGLGFRD